MACQFKQYKLVPLNVFQDLTCKSEGQSSDLKAEEKSCGSNSPRSIRKIQDRAMAQMLGEGGGDVAIPTVVEDHEEEEEEVETGAGKRKLMWLYDGDSQLPRYSKQKKLADSFERYNQILHAKIPINWKLKLLQQAKDRYDSYRQDRKVLDGAYDSEDDDDDYSKAPQDKREEINRKTAVANILINVPATKMRAVKSLTEDLMENAKHVNWNNKGLIIHPKQYKHTPHLNLKTMIDIIINKNKGSQTEMKIVRDLIRPFYDSVRDHVKNEKLIQEFEEWDSQSKRRSNRNQLGKKRKTWSYV